jgi:hypothetical protein
LLFEEIVPEEKHALTQPELIAAAVDEKIRKLKETFNESTKDKTTHVYEYLAIYIHFIGRYFTRFATKSFHECILPPTDFGGVKMAILLDPNGIQVRLIELGPSHTHATKGPSVN